MPPDGNQSAPSMRKLSLSHQGVETLLGAYDENLGYLETAFDVSVTVRGGEFTVDGSEEGEQLVSSLLTQLGELVRKGHPLRKGDVIAAARLIRQNHEVSLEDYMVTNRIEVAGGKAIWCKLVTLFN